MFDFDSLTPPQALNVSKRARDFLVRANLYLDFAFQPIVNIHNGQVMGFEALLRKIDLIGFAKIEDVFDAAFSMGVLHRLDIILRAKAIEKFATFPNAKRLKLFFNLDNRIMSSPDFFRGATKVILKEYDLPQSVLCLEISERHQVDLDLTGINLELYESEDYNTAIDDFGAGYSGLKLLHEHHPNYLKIDRYFISGIEKDKKCKLMVSSIVDLAHVLGITVIVEGIETKEELRVCSEIGCDLVQGYYVERPQIDVSVLKKEYDQVRDLERRVLKDNDDSQFIYEQIEYRPPLSISDDMETVFDAFRRNKEMNFFPVIDDNGEPLGVIHEHKLKEYAYSPFGKELIANRGTGLNIRSFLSPSPVADIQSGTDMILENFSLSHNPDGIILVKDFKYLGFLSAASLLRVINDKNLALARDCNPLTKLPGNASISQFVSEACEDKSSKSLLIYLDLDNFKVFNDAYGFRQGDRAIMLFAEVMQKVFHGDQMLLGHVGGDDFFIGVQGKELDQMVPLVRMLIDQFTSDVESFYDAETRAAGYIRRADRHGVERDFPLMTCSAAVVYLPAGRDENSMDFQTFDQVLADTKKEAKNEADHIAVFSF